jgi:hypothetical protein
VRPDDKLAALVWLLREMLPPDQSTVVFVSTRHHADFLHNLLAREGLETAVVYGAMDQVRGLGCGFFGGGEVRLKDWIGLPPTALRTRNSQPPSTPMGLPGNPPDAMAKKVTESRFV